MKAKKKKPIKKKSEGEETRGQVQITLFNVLPFLIERVAKIDRDVDRLQKTVDAIGLLLSEYGVKKPNE